MSEKIIPYQLYDEIEFNDQKKILIFTNSKSNLLSLSRSDNQAYLCYKKILSNDYILYYHEHGISKFYKRKNVNELWKRKDLHQFNDLFFTLTPPKEENKNTLSKNKLLIIFPCMPTTEDYTNSLIPKRMFPDFFMSIDKYLVKNTYILRIMDLNLSHGSHFVNTINYPTMERDIKECIKYIQETLDIESQNIVLYGVSKGGTGAILHGSSLDLKLLAVDPIIDLAEYNNSDDHYLKNFRKENISNQIMNNLVKSDKSEKYIFCSPTVEFNYKALNNINSNNLHKIEIIDSNITHHNNISKNCVPQQLMILNKLLSDLV